MAYNFPDTPTNGQVFQKWTWSSATGAWLMTSGSGGGGVGVPSDANPIMDSTAAPGTATAYSRGDHVHPSDTSRLTQAAADALYLTPAAGDTRYVNVSGDTMSGGLTTTNLALATGQAFADAGGGNLAIRPGGSGTTYFQNGAGNTNWGNVASTGMTIYGTITANSTISTVGQVNGGSLLSTGGAIYAQGWAGNPANGVLYLGNGNTYLNFDGTQFVLAGGTLGCAAISANGAITANGNLNAPGFACGSNGINSTGPYTGTSITASGTINATGDASASRFLASGNISAAGEMYVGNGGVNGIIRFGNNSGYYLFWNGASFTFNGGPLTVNSYVNVSSYVNASGSGAGIFAYNVTNPGGATTLNMMTAMPGGTASAMNIYAMHIASVWIGYQFTISGSCDFQFRHDSSAMKTGGSTSWQIISDERIKTVTGEYTTGLDAIMALRPVRYTLKGNVSLTAPQADAKPAEPDEYGYAEKVAAIEHIGLVAQEAEGPMPELVNIGTGYIDGKEVDDLRSFDAAPLVYALINAVKELKARVEALETG